MTTLKPETFHEIGKNGEARVRALLTLVRKALTNLAFDPYTQVKDTRVMYHPITPRSKLAKLDPKNYPIRSNYLQVWNDCTLEYDQNQKGAEIYVPGRRMYLGPFMLDYDDVVDLEKVIVHEYLHAALEDATTRIGYQWSHNEINRIVTQNLKYADPPNPANPSEDCNQDL
jgi:hypothetical protein